LFDFRFAIVDGRYQSRIEIESKEMAKKTENKDGNITIQYYRSSIGYAKKQKEIVRSLGITKLNQTVSREDTPATRGIVAKIPHLLRIVD